MPFVQAKCPMCGGMLAVDNNEKAAICQFCGKAFIVEEAVNNYNTYNITNNTTNQNFGEGAVVNVYENQNSVSAIMERAFMFLEDGDYGRADDYCEKVLDIEPENGKAYLGKLMADLKVKKKEDLKNCVQLFDDNINYQKFLRFSNEDLKSEIEGYADILRNKKISLEEELCAIDEEIKKITELIVAEEKQMVLKEKELQAEKYRELDCEKNLKIQYNIIKDLEKKRDSLGFFKTKQKEEYQEKLNNIEIPKYNELEKIVLAEKEKHLEAINKEFQLFEIKKEEKETREKNYRAKINELKDRRKNINKVLYEHLSNETEDELYEVECPCCGEIIYLSDEELEKEILECPYCNEKLELDIEFED